MNKDYCLALEQDTKIPEVEDGIWERSKFKKLFMTYPNIQDVYWETILALWQLLRRGRCQVSAVWQDYFMAWMAHTIFTFRFALAEF